jgi:hypothetical protein
MAAPDKPATSRTASRIPIRVELGAGLASVAVKGRAESAARLLAASLSGLMEQLGVLGQVHVSIVRTRSARSVRVRVHGQRQLYGPDVMWRAWAAVAPDWLQHHAVAATGVAGGEFPDGWISQLLEDAPDADKDPARRLVLDYTRQLVLEAIRIQAGCLIGEAQAREYVASRPRAITSAAASALAPVLRGLLDLGVSIAGSDYLLSMVDGTGALRLAPEAAIEIAFSFFRSSSVEIHIHPDFASQLVSGQQPWPTVDGTLERLGKLAGSAVADEGGRVSNELGFSLPRFEWALNAHLPERGVAVKINSSLGPPMPCIGPRELLVNTTPDLLPAGVTATLALNPRTGGACSRVDASARADLDKQIRIASPVEALALYVGGEVMRSRTRLVGGEEVATRLSGLQSAFPALAEVAIADLPVFVLTRIARQLVREHIPIRDWRRFLERLLELDSPETTDWREWVAFLRAGLPDLVSHACRGGAETLALVRLSGELEDEWPVLTEDQRELLLQQLWTEQARVDPKLERLVVVTSSSVRDKLRELIAPELPNLPVLAQAELAPGTPQRDLGTRLSIL